METNIPNLSPERALDILFSWLKAIIIIAWGNAPRTDESSTFWLKAINKSIEYGFEPKRAIKQFYLGRCPRLW